SGVGRGTWHQNPARFVCRRGGSCDDVDHPNDHGGPRFGCAELVRTFAVVLRGPQAVPRLNVEPAWLKPMIARTIRPFHLQRCYQVASVAVSLINRVSAPTCRASAAARRGRDLPR